MATNRIDSSPGVAVNYRSMPKLELHAHLSGSISPQCLHDIWAIKVSLGDSDARGLIDPLTVMGTGCQKGINLATFFPLFGKYIYNLIDSPYSIQQSTISVLKDFEADGVVYLELRTTPRAMPSAKLPINKGQYVRLVLQAINDSNKHSTKMVTRLILSVDRKNTAEEAMEVVDLALEYKDKGVVGVDLCGDPSKGDVSIYRSAFAKAKQHGLGVTLHFGEVDPAATASELATLLEFQPDRIGHVIYVPDDLKEVIKERKLGLELCLSCNVLLNMMPPGVSYTDHHFQEWRETGCPVALSTDDVGVVGSALSNEFALVAEHFKMEPEEVCALAKSGIDTIFGGETEKERLRTLMW